MTRGKHCRLAQGRQPSQPSQPPPPSVQGAGAARSSSYPAAASSKVNWGLLSPEQKDFRCRSLAALISDLRKQLFNLQRRMTTAGKSADEQTIAELEERCKEPEGQQTSEEQWQEERG